MWWDTRGFEAARLQDGRGACALLPSDPSLNTVIRMGCYGVDRGAPASLPRRNPAAGSPPRRRGGRPSRSAPVAAAARPARLRTNGADAMCAPRIHLGTWTVENREGIARPCVFTVANH